MSTSSRGWNGRRRGGRDAGSYAGGMGWVALYLPKPDSKRDHKGLTAVSCDTGRRKKRGKAYPRAPQKASFYFASVCDSVTSHVDII